MNSTELDPSTDPEWSATAPLTTKCREFGFRGATMHGLNDIILNSGLAVDYDEVSADADRTDLCSDAQRLTDAAAAGRN